MIDIKQAVESIFSPLGITLCFLLSGFVTIHFRSKARTGLQFLLIGSGLLFISIFTPIAEICMWNLERNWAPLSSVDPSSGIDRVVVLSGYARANPDIPITSNVSEQTMCRLIEGIRLYRQIPEAKIIVSGGIAGNSGKPMAVLMAELAQSLGVDGKDLLLETNSRNTYENLVEIKKTVGSSPFILVTSSYTLARAIGVAKKLGMKPIPAPACIRCLQHFPAPASLMPFCAALLRSFAHPSIERLSQLQLAYHEYAGYTWYKIQGYL